MNIGIIGRARSGKDTAGKWLVDERGYRRVALADPLKEAALRLNPIIDDGNVGYSFTAAQLSEVVDGYGWERAKEIGDTRRILQELGASIRALDEDFWLRQALKKTQEANDHGVPVVITDVRYRNEADSLRRSGFHLVYIHRPGVPRMDHESENSLTAADAGSYINNAGDVDDLHLMVEEVWELLHAAQSSRFAMKF
ncbi:hypothetical protein AB0F77_39505 [Streptomyces sp. NPDC026672]|uniref:deoxynucleotide monophosphate kinase family protein n=1 Tax=Actinomycetes TaxID=1760 RepID=UPI003406D327